MNKTEIPAPLVKHELIMRRCPNSRAISVCIATIRALEWLRHCECYFDTITHYMLDDRRLPLETTLLIPECYDFEEVWRYIAQKPFVHCPQQNGIVSFTNPRKIPI